MHGKERQMLCSIFALSLAFCATWREERKSSVLLSKIQRYKPQVIAERHKAHDSVLAMLFQHSAADHAALKCIPAPCEAFRFYVHPRIS